MTKRCRSLGKSDHDVITLKVLSKPKQKYAYNKGNHASALRELKSTNWKQNFIRDANNKSVEDVWGQFKNRLLDLRNKHVPIQKIDGVPTWKSKSSIPIDETLQNAIKEKKICHRKWSASKGNITTTDQRVKYTKANNKVRRLMRKAKREFESDIAKKAKSNPKSFWSFIRSRLKTKAGVGTMLIKRQQNLMIMTKRIFYKISSVQFSRKNQKVCYHTYQKEPMKISPSYLFQKSWCTI